MNLYLRRSTIVLMLFRVFLFLIYLYFPAFCYAQEPLFVSFSNKQVQGLVVKVVDADKIVLENGQRIQLIGIESLGLPARKYVQRDKDGNVIEEFEDDLSISIEEQALTFAQELLENKRVRLEFDAEHRSPQGYIYAYVFLADGSMANVDLLKMGFVDLSLTPPNLKYADKLRAAYQEAREEKRGILGY